MDKEQLLNTLRDLQTKFAQSNTDIRHGDISLFEIKPKAEKIINLYIYCFENGDFDLLNPNTYNSLNNDLRNLLEAINNLAQEHHRLETIKSLVTNTFIQFIPQVVAINYNNESFNDQLDKTKGYTSEAEQELLKLKSFLTKSRSNISSTAKSAQELLDKAITGVLAEQIDTELNSRWNKILLGLYSFLSIIFFIWLLCFAEDVKYALTNKSGFNFHAIIVSFIAKLPVVAMLVFLIFQLRARIKYIDILRYRKSVASSLESEVKMILDKANTITKQSSADKVRLLAIEFMVDIIKEFSSTPSTHSSQEANIGISKLANINFKDSSQ